MPMSTEDRLKAALNMIQVTPENYKSLNVKVILYFCEVVAEAEKQLGLTTSAYEGRTEEQIKERITL